MGGATRVVVRELGAVPRDLDDARGLLRAYRDALAAHSGTCFAGFDDELAALPKPYVAPGGFLLFASVGSAAAGIIGLDPTSKQLRVGPAAAVKADAEVRRLFVAPEFRHGGIGRRLVEELLDRAAALGHRRLVLHTLPSAMPGALELYRSAGFTPLPADPATPSDGVVWLAKALEPPEGV